MTWLIDNSLMAGGLIVIGFVTVALLAWALSRFKGRSTKMRSCRSCNGSGRIFTGVKADATQRGNFHVCRVCKGSGVAPA